MRKIGPTGWVAICQCGSIVGAMSKVRTPPEDRGPLLGLWLFNGYTIQPRFGSNWSVDLSPCSCELARGIEN